MTDKVNPSINRPAEAFKTAGAIALAGGSYPGYVTQASSPSELSVQDSGIDETAFNAFAESHSASSFDVTIDPGEAFVYGSWLAIDTSTTVTLASSTNNQTVYVGWNKDGTNDVIVGISSAFDSASGNTDQKIPLWDFDTDGSGVTAATDRRQIGYIQGSTSFGGDVDLQGNTLTDTSQGYLDLTGDGNDLRLATGQSIEDGGGTTRFNISSTRTAVRDETGLVTISAANGNVNAINAYSDTPIRFRDQNGAFNALHYRTNSSAPGTLELTNADLFVDTGYAEVRGSDPTLKVNDNSGGESPRVLLTDSGNPKFEFSLDGNSVSRIYDNVAAEDRIRFHYDGDVEVPNSDLRLATNQSIETGTGTKRIQMNNAGTFVHDEVGTIHFEARESDGSYIRAYSGEPIVFDDREGAFDAVKYLTSSNSPGTLEMTNATLDMNDNQLVGPNAIELHDTAGDGNNWFIQESGNSQLRMRHGASTQLELFAGNRVDISQTAANLRIATGQAIEDGSGNKRFVVGYGFTQIRDSNGNGQILFVPGSANRYFANSTTPIIWQDSEGGFSALKYFTSSSAPGTLELSNAVEYIYPQDSGAELGVGNRVRANNNNGVTYFSTSLELGQTLGYRTRIGNDEYSDAYNENANASFEIASYGGQPNAGGGEINFINTRYGERTGAITSKREDGRDGYVGIYTFGGGTPTRRVFISEFGNYVGIENSNLRLGTGQGIKDGGGTQRIEINSANTFINDEVGNTRIDLTDGFGVQLEFYSGEGNLIYDNAGDFQAMRYNASYSAPGTLELTNADLQTRDNGQIRVANVAGGTLKVRDPYDAIDIIRFNQGGSINIHGSVNNLSHKLLFEDNGGDIQAYVRGDNNDLIATDGAGNRTTLT